MVDVEDCAAAARALIATGRADPDKIAIEGGSAGGFTTLAALCFTDVFRAGACRYAVCDLTAMAEDTHRFEARYCDGLVGAWPTERHLYEKRSPLLHANQIRCPVLFFQGLQDKVVPPEQTERMAEALRKNGIPVEVRLFEDEGHGFRNQATQIKVLKETEAFFRHQLGLAEQRI
jgi:dipeptidyl aminopeptidase/acylaminoacyl peptidase